MTNRQAFFRACSSAPTAAKVHRIERRRSSNLAKPADNPERILTIVKQTMKMILASARRFAIGGVLALAVLSARASLSDGPLPAPGNGKLLLTEGVSSIDGAAGGGLTPWALIGSYAADDEWGATAFVTHVRTQDYGLSTFGAAIGLRDRVEFSVAQQQLDAGVVVPGAVLKLDIVGVKVKLAGDAVFDSDRWMPQVAAGIESKHVGPGQAVGGVLDSVGAKRDGLDVYLSATKLFLAQAILVNGTLRATRANQNGLLGFASATDSAYHVEPEVSLAWLLRRDIAIGAEYRFKPDNLAFAGSAFHEDDWKDVFIALAPTKHVSITAAYVDLGNIVGHNHQSGAYLSLQLAY